MATSLDSLAKSLFSTLTSGIDLEPLKGQMGAILSLQLTGISVGDEDGVGDLAKHNSQLFSGISLTISQTTKIIRHQDLSLAEFHDLNTEAMRHPDLYNT